MKKIEAVIQPHKLEEVQKALAHIGMDKITISEVRGQGKEKGQQSVFRGAAYKPNGDFLPKIKLEIFVPDYLVEQIIGVVSDAAMSGEIGDGKIFVSSIEEAIRIRNGDRGEDAL
jgi:nitrogen regulatory protein P-II 1